jgi:formate hydrogenlyase subunit 6/NADH:ubiquinone oxidoreductase subunit I
MIDVIRERLRQGHRTMRYPDAPPPPLPERFRGRPALDASKCQEGCADCAEACPTGAIDLQGGPRIDLGRCLFCAECASACPEGALAYSGDYRLPRRSRAGCASSSGARSSCAR